jgi:hypothetical protein
MPRGIVGCCTNSHCGFSAAGSEFINFLYDQVVLDIAAVCGSTSIAFARVHDSAFKVGTTTRQDIYGADDSAERAGRPLRVRFSFGPLLGGRSFGAGQWQLLP